MYWVELCGKLEDISFCIQKTPELYFEDGVSELVFNFVKKEIFTGATGI